MTSGFFAYSSVPASVGEAVREAITEINKSGFCGVTGWESLRIGGQVIVDTICRHISSADFVCADLTSVNANVLFELGFAIARKKHVWVTLDDSLSKSRHDFEQLRTLTTVGFRPYQNSGDIVKAFYKDAPYSLAGTTVFQSAIEATLIPGQAPSLLYLKALYDTPASVRVTRRVQACGIPVVLHDPKEAGAQSLAWYAQKAFDALGVLVHLTASDREGAALNNARAALVAGMGYGFSKPLLILTSDDTLTPLDYRDLAARYTTASAAESRCTAWLAPILEGYDSAARGQSGVLRLSTELRHLRLGEHIAEDEADTLPDYFVETATYSQLLLSRQLVLVGRKGSGKTAMLLRAAKDLSDDRRNLVCVVKPASYELEGVLSYYSLESSWGARNPGLKRP